jgi:hypothetical protein
VTTREASGRGISIEETFSDLRTAGELDRIGVEHADLLKSTASPRDTWRLEIVVGQNRGSRPSYAGQATHSEMARKYGGDRHAAPALSDSEKRDALGKVIAQQAELLMLTAGELDDMLVQMSGGWSDPESKAWALLALPELQRGGKVLNAEAEIVYLSGSTVGRQVIDSPQRVREAWALLHQLGHKQFYTDDSLQRSIASKIRAKARTYRIRLPGEYEPRTGAGMQEIGGEGPDGVADSGELAATLRLSADPVERAAGLEP